MLLLPQVCHVALAANSRICSLLITPLPAVYTAFYLQQAAVLFSPNGTRALHVGLGVGTAVKGMQRMGVVAGEHTGAVPAAPGAARPAERIPEGAVPPTAHAACTRQLTLPFYTPSPKAWDAASTASPRAHMTPCPAGPLALALEVSSLTLLLRWLSHRNCTGAHVSTPTNAPF